MPAFNSVIYEHLIDHVTELQQVRIKIDPKQWSDGVEVSKINEFVGYILQEFEDGSVDIFVPDQGFDNPIMRVLQSQLGSMNEPTRYELLKRNVLKQLSSKGVDTDDVRDKITNCDCIHDVVDTMKMNNFADSEVIEHLKEYISETEDSKQL